MLSPEKQTIYYLTQMGAPRDVIEFIVGPIPEYIDPEIDEPLMQVCSSPAFIASGTIHGVGDDVYSTCSSVVRVDVGEYDVIFDTPYIGTQYKVFLQAQTLDTQTGGYNFMPNVYVCPNSKTETGFKIIVRIPVLACHNGCISNSPVPFDTPLDYMVVDFVHTPEQSAQEPSPE